MSPARLIPLLFSLSFLLQACSGTDTISGTVYRRDGSPANGVPLRLIAVNDRGEEMAQIASTVADSQGRFRLEERVPAGASVLLETLDPAGKLRGFAAGRSDFRGAVHPMTEALVEAVIGITGPDGGKSLTDFDSNAVAALTDRLFALDSKTLDLSDASAVRTFVLKNVGRLISEASGAASSAVSSTGFDPPNVETVPSFATTVRCALAPVHEITSSDFTFDLSADGRVCDGYSPLAKDAFDLAFQLSILNDTFVANGVNQFPSDALAAKILDSRTLVVGPQALTSGVTVTRKVYIPVAGNYARFLDIIENPTVTDRPLDVEISGNLGSDITTTLVTKGGSNESIAPTDRYAATCDTAEFDATVGYVWQDNGGNSVVGPQFVGSGNPDLFSWLWPHVQVPAGGRRTFIYYTWLTRDRIPDVLGTTLLGMAEDPDMSRMSGTEIMALTNFAPNRGNVVGDAGAIVAGSAVTVQNKTKGTSFTTTARPDWSFYAALAVSPGDAIQVSATDGFLVDLAAK